MRSLLVAFLLLISPQANAASRVWIAEFGTSRVEAQAPFANLPVITNQPALDLSAGVKQSLPFNPNTRYIRVVCEVQCALTVKGTATVNSTFLPALRPEYFGVAAGSTLSVIAVP
jgi:hypothetical protein